MRLLRCLLIAILILAVAGLAGGYMFLRGGIGTTDEPSRAEAYVARRLRNFAIPSEARSIRNPFANDVAAWRPANPTFQEHCALCHDSDGRGRAKVGQRLYPRAPDMAAADTQELTDGELFYIIRNGVRLTGMPGWSDLLSEEESWRLVSFVRHLPRLTPEELTSSP
jgi:mono/diheme cytochrome c family protein